MKKFLVLATLCLVGICCYAQSMGIRFYDRQGREFVVYAPSGQFSYSMFEGDNVTRNINGDVNQVGRTFISYNMNGQVSSIGDVYISYDIYGRVVSVGGLYIYYDMNGNIQRTSGRVKR